MLSSQTSDGSCQSENTRIEKKFSFSGKLNGFGKIDNFPRFRYRWNSNEEVFTILTSFQEHKNWTLNEVKVRPPNGSQLLYNKTNFKCIYCSYVHSALVPTFHRRCYWLLENPEIVLVHYLNLPDESTTHDHLVTSLLPFREMQEQELINQLQPILTTTTGHEDDDNRKIANIDIDELISEVKRYKEPTPNGRIDQDDTLPSDKPQLTSVQLRNFGTSRTLDQTPYASGKCSNCNQNLATKSPIDVSHQNANIAVTTNKQPSFFGGYEHRAKPLVSPNQQTYNFVPAEVSSKLNTGDHRRQIKGASHEQVTRSQRKDRNENLINSAVFVNGCSEFIEQHPTASQPDSCRINDTLVALDYDGLDLIPGNATEGDVTKELDMNLFDNDLLDYLPDYLSDINGLSSEERKSNCPDVVSATCSGVREQYYTSETLKTASDDISFSSSASNDTISGATSLIYSGSHHPGQQSFYQNMLKDSTIDGNMLRSSSPFIDTISTDCHTFNRLTSNPLDSSCKASVPEVGLIVTSELNSHQCSSFPSPQALLCLDEESTKSLAPSIGVSPIRSQTATTSDTFELKHNNVNTDSRNYCSSVYRLNAPLLSESECTGTASMDMITEYSPEWSYCEGKTKVLILGHWSHHDGSYTCLFDGYIVPAILIQSGVLRCFCPPHEAGLVALQVAWNGFIVSNACVFEYKTREKPANSVQDWLGVSDVDLTKLIVERIERLEATLNIVTDAESVRTVSNLEHTLEDRIVEICDLLFKKPPVDVWTDLTVDDKGLSLLHLAAALGYTKLIHLLRHNTGSQLKQRLGNEVDSSDVMTPITEWTPLSKDSFGCSPLMWACWRGHTDSALALLAWEPSSYDDCDNTGRSPKRMAEEMGHEGLAQKMEEFISCKINDSFLLMDGSSPLPSPSSSCAYLSVSSNERQLASPVSEHSLTWERVEGSSEDSVDFEMVSVTSEERPNTLGKVLVEIRTLIQEAEERARSAQSPFQSADVSTPFTVGFSGFSDLPYQDESLKDELSSETRLNPRTCDSFSADSNSPTQTPSTLSPGSPAVRSSPKSNGTDTSEFEEFLSKPRKFLEKDFSELTLTDTEQQELLQAAKVIQNAYRQFKIRKKQHVDELKAAVLIQSYYRRYKQFALYRKITKAAVLIQNSYRAHKEHEQFKKSRHAAAIIQNYFRHYRKRKQRHAEEDAPGKRLETKYRKPCNGK